MKRMILVMALILSGCASPPGSFVHSDFTWKQITVEADYETVYSRYIDASRKCNGIWDMGLKGYVFNKEKSGYIDIFLPRTLFVGMSGMYVEGRVDFKYESEKATAVNIGLLKNYTNPKDSTGHLKQLEAYAKGIINCLKE